MSHIAQGLAEEHFMLCGPKDSGRRSDRKCGICEGRCELFELPGRAGRLCLSCGADLAISEQLAIEIDAATLTGQQTESLVAEFAQLSQRLLARAQSA
jgi:hypothetical protein